MGCDPLTTPAPPLRRMLRAPIHTTKPRSDRRSKASRRGILRFFFGMEGYKRGRQRHVQHGELLNSSCCDAAERDFAGRSGCDDSCTWANKLLATTCSDILALCVNMYTALNGGASRWDASQ